MEGRFFGSVARIAVVQRKHIVVDRIVAESVIVMLLVELGMTCVANLPNIPGRSVDVIVSEAKPQS